MNYTFFDIECCDGVHICSFGYLQTTTSFKSLTKADILINPEMRFHLGPRNKTTLKLSYPNDMFFRQPPFPHFYGKLRKLLLNRNTILIGFSIGNDFNFINLACERYKLKQLNLRGFDVQKLHKIITNDNEVKSLEKVAEMHNITNRRLRLHKSCDDAELTMYILRKICKELNLTFAEIMNKHPDCIVQSKIYVRKNKIKNNTIKTPNSPLRKYNSHSMSKTNYIHNKQHNS